jgi:DNA-binding MarR family transcriptional regulator
MALPIEELLDQVRLLWHVMVQAAERLHEREPVTLGMRAVLEFLARKGPTAVPHIARSRHVTRQHIQALVNDLLELRLVSLDDNPAHRRSALVRLTPEGQRAIDRMKRRERQFFGRLELKARPDDLRRAAGNLNAVREALEADHEHDAQRHRSTVREA